MASEASVIDQTVNEPIQGTKEANGLKNDETKDVNGKEDEVKVEDTTVVEIASHVQEELKQQDSETQNPEDGKETAGSDDKSASALSVESAQKEVESECNLPAAQVEEVTKEEVERTDETVQKEVENEINSPNTQESVNDQVAEVTEEEAKDNEAVVEPVESVEKVVEDPVNFLDTQENGTQDEEVTEEVTKDRKSDLAPAVESAEKQVEIQTISPPTQDTDTQSVEIVKEEAKDNYSALELSHESAGTKEENANNLSAAPQSDTEVKEEIRVEVTDTNQDLEQSVESVQEELEHGTKISDTPESSNETLDKTTEEGKDIVQESEAEVTKELVGQEVVRGVRSELPEIPAELASESVAEDKVVEPTTDTIQEPTDERTDNNTNETTDLSQVEKTVDDEVQVKLETLNEVPPSNGTSELATEDKAAKSESLVVENPTEMTSEPKNVVEAVASDIVIVKKDDDSNITSDTKEFENEKDNSSVCVISSATATVTENEAILESVVEDGKKDQENTVEVEKPTLTEKLEDTATTEFENQAVAETNDTIAENDIAKENEEAKDSAAPEGAAEEKDETLESTSRDIDIVGIANNVAATISETSETDTVPKQAETKQTLLDKFASEASEDKKEEDAGHVEERSLPETTTDGNDTKTDEEVSNQEIAAKTSQRQSNNIISKVKKSLVKVKKAITGKSPSSKTTTSESKDIAKA